MSSDGDHFLAKRIEEFQRQNSKGFVCHLCEDSPSFSTETKLFDHATALHGDTAGSSKHDRAWKAFVADASSRAKHRSTSRLATNQAVSSTSQTCLNMNAHSPSNRPASIPGPIRSTNKKIEDLMELSLDYRLEPTTVNIQRDNELGSPQTNQWKRAAVGEPGLSDQATQQGEFQGPSRSRRARAMSGSFFDPNSDRTTLAPNIRKAGMIEGAVPSRRIYDARSHLFRSPKDSADDRDRLGGPSSRPTQPLETDKPCMNSGMSIGYSFHQEMPDHGESDTYLESEPELLFQPETRPISHEQLCLEVKGIYAGLVMVESKCIDVDDKQTIAALEKNPLKQTKLTPEQWQALIALHKTLLHEHHDFFLASQHPSASPALSRLAAKYSMPGRMWRHGIHAFLEVLRHRLPDSLDHMLAFIYIAYSMMALLYETVPTFEDTWIECLGDLGRYRIAIEDDDTRDREGWSDVARLWYRKAADKNPKIGRLYHHLAILARPYTLQQLILYTSSLTCVEPFESAKASIMTLFNPILDGKEYAHHRSSSMETVFIKAHGLLFTQGPVPAFQDEGALSHIPDSPPRERECSFDSSRPKSYLPPMSDKYNRLRRKVSKIKRGLSSFVNGSRLSVLADTGAAKNVISAAYVKERKIPIDASPSSFRLGNSVDVNSIGTVTVDYAFAEEPSNIYKLTCHVLPNCIYDLILGNAFLTATETMSRYRRRLTECIFSVVNMFHLGFLGNNSLQLEGVLADTFDVTATPDTGAERNVIDFEFAISLNLEIRNQPEHCGFLQFADGSFQKTLGQVDTFWTFASGERIPITFEVLENCCSNIIIGEDILWDYNVFEDHSSSIISVSETGEEFHLAPFGYEQGWQNLFSRSKARDHVSSHSHELSQQAEEQRRHMWRYKYGIDGAKASPEEQNAERARRDRYKELSQQKPLPLIPSIQTAHALPRSSETRGNQQRGISSWFRSHGS